MSLHCDPKEVLFHLRLLGYENVSEMQLKEFIRDLKKLIKYDLKRSCKRKEENNVKCVDSPYDSSYCSSSIDVRLYEDSASSSGGSDASSNESTSSFTSDSVDIPCYSKKTEKSAVKHEKFPNSRYHEDKKPKSFIKSWKLNQPPADIKCDPVSLYHWYQEYWNKQKVPGEDPHKKLRWAVREKMLGDDPHPRPFSQASGRSSRNCRK
ncbi:uncharacterized protein LOC124157809 [Ischnura elegans]|uniref:uncharacterized protein LOC124157809 n=1 Tax=Ischnura elegans TaxID=197161 RepID=UPI001ED872D2|nr:uncharacterized protein LOC124157809 [Ischnura elegans]